MSLISSLKQNLQGLVSKPCKYWLASFRMGLITTGALLTDSDYFGGNNAIADGYLRWLQSGTSTLVQIDVDGTAGTSETFATLVTLNNITATNLTANNFLF
jgi:hypothetical protein